MMFATAQSLNRWQLRALPSALSRHLADALDSPYIVIAVITVIAAILRIYHLGAKSLWLDEAQLYWFANGDLEHVLQQNALYNSAPPAFPLLISGVMSINGSESGLRAISCLAGIAAIPTVYVLAKEFVSRRWAGFSALTAAIAPSQIQYSQQLREYSLVFLLSTTMLIAFCRFLRRQSWGSVWVLATVVTLSLFTQYGLAVLFAAINFFFIAMVFKTPRPARAVALWLPVALSAAAAAAAVYHLALKQQWVAGGRAADYLSAGYWDHSLWSLGRMAILNTTEIFNFAFPTPLVILVCILGVLHVVEADRRRTALWLLAAPIGLTFVMAIVRAYPYLGARQSMFLTPMVYVFVALGMTYLSRERNNHALAAILAILIIGYGLRHSAAYLWSARPENIRPIIGTLLTSMSRDDRIYVHSGAAPAFSYYVQSRALPWIAGENKDEEPEKFDRQLDVLVNERSKVWLVFSHIQQDELRRVLMHIAAHRKLELVRQDEGAWLYLAL